MAKGVGCHSCDHVTLWKTLSILLLDWHQRLCFSSYHEFSRYKELNAANNHLRREMDPSPVEPPDENPTQ